MGNDNNINDMCRELWRLIKMLFASRPSDVAYQELEVVDMKHFPFKGYKAMTWCGKIIHRIGTSDIDAKTLNHERIHVMQAMYHTNDSWVRYYLSYLWEYIRRGVMSPMSGNYHCSKYESEAYANEGDMNYCDNYDVSNLSKYVIKNAKELYKQLGCTPTAWKEYIKKL